jgi:signal peptidase I
MNESKFKNNKTIKILGTALCSIMTIGLGQISCGKIKRGIAIYIVSLLLVPVSVIICTQNIPPFNMIIPAVLFIGLIIFAMIDSILIAINPENTLNMKPVLGYLLIICIWQIDSRVVSPAIARTLKSDYLQAYKIPSEAMTPTLLVGDHILVNKHIYKNHEPADGDIVIFPYPNNPEKDFIMRIIAVGGDTIEIRKKKTFLNGKLLSESYATHTDSCIIPAAQHPRDYYGPVKIPIDSVFVMGDNRDNAFDSRFWGVINKRNIKAKIINLYWSWDNAANKVRWGRIGKSIS